MKNRWIAILICWMLCLTLSACGGDRDEGEAASAAEPAAEVAVADTPTEEPTPEPTAEPAEEPTPAPPPTFAVLGAQATVTRLSDKAEDIGDQGLESETERPVMVTMVFDEPADISTYFSAGGSGDRTFLEFISDGISLVDSTGASYDPYNFSVPLESLKAESAGLPDSMAEMSLLFMVPNGTPLTGMTLRFPDGAAANLDTDIGEAPVADGQEAEASSAPAAAEAPSALDAGIACMADPDTKAASFEFVSPAADHVKVFMMVKGHDGTHLAYSNVLGYWEQVTEGLALSQEFFLYDLQYQVVENGRGVGDEMTFCDTKAMFPSADMVMVTVVGDVWYEQVVFSDWVA